MLAEHFPGRRHHRFLIQRVRVVIHVARQQWRADIAAVNAISIGFPPRRFARMKIGRRIFRLQHPDRRRQEVIQRHYQVARGNRRSQFARRYLRQRMHSGIGAPRALRQHGLPRNPQQRLGQSALDGAMSRLHLPTMKVGAIVGDSELEISHVNRLQLIIAPRVFTVLYSLPMLSTQAARLY